MPIFEHKKTKYKNNLIFKFEHVLPISHHLISSNSAFVYIMNIIRRWNNINHLQVPLRPVFYPGKNTAIQCSLLCQTYLGLS